MVAGQSAGVTVTLVGRMGGDAVTLGPDSAPLSELKALWSGAFAAAIS